MNWKGQFVSFLSSRASSWNNLYIFLWSLCFLPSENVPLILTSTPMCRNWAYPSSSIVCQMPPRTGPEVGPARVSLVSCRRWVEAPFTFSSLPKCQELDRGAGVWHTQQHNRECMGSILRGHWGRGIVSLPDKQNPWGHTKLRGGFITEASSTVADPEYLGWKAHCTLRWQAAIWGPRTTIHCHEQKFCLSSAMNSSSQLTVYKQSRASKDFWLLIVEMRLYYGSTRTGN